jgi:hypothetical protein
MAASSKERSNPWSLDDTTVRTKGRPIRVCPITIKKKPPCIFKKVVAKLRRAIPVMISGTIIGDRKSIFNISFALNLFLTNPRAASVPILVAPAVAVREMNILFLTAANKFWSSTADLYHFKVNSPKGKVEYLDELKDMIMTITIGAKRKI